MQISTLCPEDAVGMPNNSRNTNLIKVKQGRLFGPKYSLIFQTNCYKQNITFWIITKYVFLDSNLKGNSRLDSGHTYMPTHHQPDNN